MDDDRSTGDPEFAKDRVAARGHLGFDVFKHRWQILGEDLGDARLVAFVMQNALDKNLDRRPVQSGVGVFLQEQRAGVAASVIRTHRAGRMGASQVGADHRRIGNHKAAVRGTALCPSDSSPKAPAFWGTAAATQARRESVFLENDAALAKEKRTRSAKKRPPQSPSDSARPKSQSQAELNSRR